MTGVSWQVSAATAADAPELAKVAAQCFPLACPPSVPPGDVAAFIGAHLSEGRFAEYLADRSHHVLVARSGGRIVGYTLLLRPSEADPAELSKMYVLPEFHGGPAGELMRHALDWAIACGAPAVWLGVNRANERAQRFYRRHGFEVTGTRSFQIGESLESDFIMERRLPTPSD